MSQTWMQTSPSDVPYCTMRLKIPRRHYNEIHGAFGQAVADGEQALTKNE